MNHFNLDHYPLWTAVVTPMHADESIDYVSFEKLLRLQEKAKNGIVVLGSTGEALNLSRRECKKVLEFATSLNLAVPLMTGIPGSQLEDTLSYLDYLETLPLHAYLVVTPLYAKPGTEGQTRWFKKIMDKATRPCMLYNVPGRTAVKMSFETVKNLANHPRFWAIKEASGSPSDFKKYTQHNPSAKMYSGDDGMMFEFAPLSCQGLVSVASNIWPFETRKYVDLALEGKLTPEDVELWKKASDTLFIASNPVPVKNILYQTGLIQTKTMRLPLSAHDLKNNAPLMNAHLAVTEWYKKHA